jgi:Fic family protein
MQTPVEERIARLRAELDGLRPLSAKSVAALDAWYDVELTYTSNALEGNTLTRSETAIVLEKGITVSGKPLKDHLEAAGHKDALGYVRELAASAEPVREMDVRNIHRLVIQRIDPEEAGSYSGHQRMISGSPLLLPSPAEIPGRMGDFARWLAAEAAGLETAFDAHERLVTIHPFSDGNGRTARLLMNLLLLRAGYPPLVIVPEQRPAYHDSLQAVQLHGDRATYHRFLLATMEESLSRYVEMLRGGAGDGLEHFS